MREGARVVRFATVEEGQALLDRYNQMKEVWVLVPEEGLAALFFWIRVQL